MSPLAKNTASNVSLFVAKLMLIFVMTPIFIASLGAHDYGVWEILGALVGYLGILDLGLRPAVARYAAARRAAGTPQERQQLYSTALLTFGGIGVFCAAVFAAAAFTVPELLAPEGVSDADRYSLVLLIFAAWMLFSFPGHVCESFLEGYQRYVVKNNVVLVAALFSAGAFVWGKDHYDPLLLLATLNLLVSAGKLATFAALLHGRVSGALVPFVGGFHAGVARELLGFGGKSTVQGASMVVENRTDVLLIGALLGPDRVPFYTIPAALLNYVRNLGATITHALLPAFSTLFAQADRNAMRGLFLQGSRYTVAIMMPIFVGAAFLGSTFIGIWIGPEFEEAARWIVPLLVVYVALPAFMPLNGRIITAMNRHGIFARLLPIQALGNAVLSWFLIQEYGLVGAALGSLIPCAIISPLIMRASLRELELPASLYLRECIHPIIVPIGGLIAVLVLAGYFLTIDSYSRLLLLTGAGAAVYLPLAAMFVLTVEERNYLRWRFFHRRSATAG